MSRPPNSSWFNHPNSIRWRIQAVNFISEIHLGFIISGWWNVCIFLRDSFTISRLSDIMWIIKQTFKVHIYFG
jgi:hypothetical protein